MGVGAGLYMYVVVVQKFTFAISSPDEFLLCQRRVPLSPAAAASYRGQVCLSAESRKSFTNDRCQQPPRAFMRATNHKRPRVGHNRHHDFITDWRREYRFIAQGHKMNVCCQTLRLLFCTDLVNYTSVSM